MTSLARQPEESGCQGAKKSVCSETELKPSLASYSGAVDS